MAESPRPWPRSLVTPRTWTAPEEETRRRTETVPSMCSLMASAVYSGRGLKRTFGATLLLLVAGPDGLGMGGGAFWPRLTTPGARPGAFIGPVPPVTPSLTPTTPDEALLLPFMFWLPAEPEPRLTTLEAGPVPLLEAGMPAMPLLPRSTAAVAGRFDGAMGLSGRPSATAVG